MSQSEGKKTKRALSLDALRGYAILSMVLSGTIAFGILPDWMYHAQVPPPNHKFDPAIFGITWVDLVFPFFLFAMGAAFPFSVGKRLRETKGKAWAILNTFSRGIQLTFFAIFIQHLYPWILSNPQDTKAWLTTILAFLLMFPMFMRFPDHISSLLKYGIKFLAFAVGLSMMLTINYANNRSFDPGFSNIIILVLANMAIFGSLSYILTHKNKLARIAILPFIMAVFLGNSNEGSWVQTLFNYSPVPWMYKFYYLKYLFIVIPGTIAGEYLLDWMKKNATERQYKETSKLHGIILASLALSLIITNLILLFCRQLLLNLAITSTLLLVGYIIVTQTKGDFASLWKKLFLAGSYLLMLGLFFEAYEGGIRKDHSTYSYYFVTSGLAFMALMLFSVICDFLGWIKSTRFLVMTGQNPMIAYVSSAMLIMPALNILGMAKYLDLLNTNPWLGFLKGVILTTLVTLVTMGFTRLKWFWRT